MAWARIETGFRDHPKIVGLSDVAFRTWVLGLLYAVEHLTNGAVPRAVAYDRKAASELIAAGLWDTSDGGWQMHDFLEYQPSADQVRSQREAARKRMARLRRDQAGRFD